MTSSKPKLTGMSERVGLPSGRKRPAASRAVFPMAPPGRSGWPWVAEETGHEARAEQSASWPRITIVTPSFNQAEYLEETIRSVLLQHYPNLEYFVVDGGSTDGSVAILEKYSPWIDWWVSEKDHGQANALNKGFERASGDIFAYLNSDDVFTPNALQRAASSLFRHKSRRKVVSFAGEVWDGVATLQVVAPKVRPSLVAWLRTSMSLFQPATFWTRALHVDLRGFDESMQFSFDKDFFFRALFLRGSYEAVPGPAVARFRVHPLSKTSTLEQVRDAENERIRTRYEALSACQKYLVRELRMETAHQEVLRSLQEPGIWRRSKCLVRAARLAPAQVASRFYLGALRRLLSERPRRLEED